MRLWPTSAPPTPRVALAVRRRDGCRSGRGSAHKRQSGRRALPGQRRHAADRGSTNIPRCRQTPIRSTWRVVPTPRVVGVVAVLLSREQHMQGMVEIVRPGGVHSVPAAVSLSNQARVVVRALSDQVDVPSGFHCQGGNPVSKFLNERVRGVIQYSVYRVEPQGVDMALAQPPKRILDEVVPNASLPGPSKFMAAPQGVL